jgi:hypothetical protein
MAIAAASCSRSSAQRPRERIDVEWIEAERIDSWKIGVQRRVGHKQPIPPSGQDRFDQPSASSVSSVVKDLEVSRPVVSVVVMPGASPLSRFLRQSLP